MKLENIEQSIVIVADRHNPSILHPSFLEKQGIVDDLDLSEPAITTPDISITSFRSGLRITVDSARLQFTNHKVEESKFDLSAVASKYLEVLPHVDYKSVGCNVFVFIEKENAEFYLINKFIKQGPWNNEDNTPTSTGLRFVYRHCNSVVNLSYDAGKLVINDEKERPGILIRGNYHTDISGAEDAIIAIADFKKNINEIMSIIEKSYQED